MRVRLRVTHGLGLFLATLFAAGVPARVIGGGVQGGIRVLRDVEYARVGDKPLLLDLYLPPSPGKPLPLVIWIPGSNWDDGDKAENPPVFLNSRGFAVASINYRHSHEAIFPAQIHDCKAAVRYLRAHAKEINVDPDNFGAFGSSAGGHLAALLAVSAGVKDLEGNEGNPKASSAIQAAVIWSAPLNFLTLGDGPSQVDLVGPDSAVARLIGGPVAQNRDKAAKASPITYVTARVAPYTLVIHNVRDPIIPINQAQQFVDAIHDAWLKEDKARMEDAIRAQGWKGPVAIPTLKRQAIIAYGQENAHAPVNSRWLDPTMRLFNALKPDVK